MNRFVLPPLPFDSGSLAPVISSETIDYHYKKHHQGYVDKLNSLLPGSGFEESSLEDIILNASPGPLFNNAAQSWNHAFYWDCIAPKPKTKPDSSLLAAIDRSFGSFQEFVAQFQKKSIDLFGSGWAWIAVDPKGVVLIDSTRNAKNPLKDGHVPLLCCDVWEHAYYIDYRNERAKYVSNFFKILNWEFADKNYAEFLSHLDRTKRVA